MHSASCSKLAQGGPLNLQSLALELRERPRTLA